MAEGGPWGCSLPHVPDLRQLPQKRLWVRTAEKHWRWARQGQQARVLSTEAEARTQGGLMGWDTAQKEQKVLLYLWVYDLRGFSQKARGPSTTTPHYISSSNRSYHRQKTGEFLCCDTSKQFDIMCYSKRSQQIKTLTHQTNLHTLQTTPSPRTKQIKAFCPHDKLPSYDFFSHFNTSKIGMS